MPLEKVGDIATFFSICLFLLLFFFIMLLCFFISSSSPSHSFHIQSTPTHPTPPTPPTQAKILASTLTPEAPDLLCKAGRRLAGEMKFLAVYGDLKTIRMVAKRVRSGEEGYGVCHETVHQVSREKGG